MQPRILLITTAPITIRTFYAAHIDSWRQMGWHVDAVSGEPDPLLTHVVRMSRRPFAPRNAWAVFALLRLLRRQRPHLVLTSTAVSSTLIRLAALLTPKVKVIYCALGFDITRPRTLRMLPFVVVERLLAGRTCTIAVVNNDDFAEVSRWRRPLAPRQVTLIPSLGVKLLEFRGTRRLSDPPRVGVLAELTDRKRVHLAIQASALVKEPHQVLIGGQGPKADWLRRLADELSPSVQLVGWVENTEEWLSRLDALLLTSRREGLPHCVIEAMMVGIPVIGTDARGTRDLLRDGAGILVDDEPEHIAEAIRQAISPAFDPTSMVLIARNRATQYEWPHAHAELTQLISQVHLRPTT